VLKEADQYWKKRRKGWGATAAERKRDDKISDKSKDPGDRCYDFLTYFHRKNWPKMAFLTQSKAK
jgi:hypothetical protein